MMTSECHGQYLGSQGPISAGGRSFTTVPTWAINCFEIKRKELYSRLRDRQIDCISTCIRFAVVFADS